MVHAPEGRPAAIAKMCAALEETQIKGVATNLEFLRIIAAAPRYAAGDTTTKFVEHLDYAPHAGGRAGGCGRVGAAHGEGVDGGGWVGEWVAGVLCKGLRAACCMAA